MKLSKFILGAAFTVAANSAMAAGPSPEAGVHEQAGWVGLESCLSAIATVIAKTGCNPAIIFPVDVDVEDDGNGAVKCGGLLDFDLTHAPVSTKGYLWTVVGTGTLLDTVLKDFLASYGSDLEGSMLYGRADMRLGGNAEDLPDEEPTGDRYDEHIIKDFWLVDPSTVDEDDPNAGADVKDDGLEIITKLDYPRAKWFQESYHTRPNGGDGSLSVTKTRIAPDSTSNCSMTYSAGVDHNIGAFWRTIGGFVMVTP